VSSGTLLGLALAVGAVLGACDGDGREAGWTTVEAESIASVRGLPVEVRRCEGIGEAEEQRYRRLRCVAGARLPGERFDTVAVTFEVVPGEGERPRLENVRFFGGPGIP
jgi:hypothetical protein